MFTQFFPRNVLTIETVDGLPREFYAATCYAEPETNRRSPIITDIFEANRIMVVEDTDRRIGSVLLKWQQENSRANIVGHLLYANTSANYDSQLRLFEASPDEVVVSSGYPIRRVMSIVEQSIFPTTEDPGPRTPVYYHRINHMLGNISFDVTMSPASDLDDIWKL